MEPERHIEKLLRAFARKRREQAGAPPELHPAMRRQLQDEIARRASKPKASEGNFFATLFVTLRPRLAFAAFVVVVCLAGTWLLLPLSQKETMNASKRDNFSTAEKRADAATTPAQPAAESTPAKLEAAKEQANEGERQRREPVSLAQNKQVPEKPATVAPAGTALKDQMLDTDSDSLVKKAKADEGSVTLSIVSTNQSLLAMDRAREFDVVAPAAAERGGFGAGGGAGGGGAGGEGAANSVTFRRIQNQPAMVSTISPVQPSDFLNVPGAASVSNLSLLSSFAIEQNGRALRVVDQDGSVYNGYVQFEETAVPASPPARTQRDATTSAMAQPTTRDAESKAARAWSFRVSGTNLSLKQNIVFSGNLLAGTNETFFSQISTQAVGGLFPATTQMLLFQNSRIQGTAVIENTGKVEIQAAPAVGRQ